MRSTLIRPRKRQCPMRDNRGFSRVEFDFFRRPVFRCHSCDHTWTTERGSQVGTDSRPRFGGRSILEDRDNG